jgi:hypothetical protein
VHADDLKQNTKKQTKTQQLAPLALSSMSANLQKLSVACAAARLLFSHHVRYLYNMQQVCGHNWFQIWCHKVRTGFVLVRLESHCSSSASVHVMYMGKLTRHIVVRTAVNIAFNFSVQTAMKSYLYNMQQVCGHNWFQIWCHKVRTGFG